MPGAAFNFRGLMAPVFTPFRDNPERDLNLDVVPEYARFLLSNNINGILVNGTTGEATSQTVDEREKVAEAWIAAAEETGQVVVVQVGGTSLKLVQRLASHAEKAGAAAILCLADLFHRPKTAEDLAQYLKLVSAHAPRTPLLYYHLPDVTGIDVNMKEFIVVAERELPNFAGIKFTSNDLAMGSACLSVARDKYAIFLGSDVMLLPAFAAGFDSAIGTTLNMMADANWDVVRNLADGNVSAAARSQQVLTASVDAIAKNGTWVGTMKSAMNSMTPIRVGPVREPLAMLTPEEMQRVKDAVTAIQSGKNAM